MYYKISHETSKKGKSQEIVDQWLPGARPRNRDWLQTETREFKEKIEMF